MSTEEFWKELGVELPEGNLVIAELDAEGWIFPTLPIPEGIESWLQEGSAKLPELHRSGFLLRYYVSLWPAERQRWNEQVALWKERWTDAQKSALQFFIGEQEGYLVDMAESMEGKDLMECLECLEDLKAVARAVGIEVGELPGLQEMCDRLESENIEAVKVFGEDYVYHAKWNYPECHWLHSPQWSRECQEFLAMMEE